MYLGDPDLATVSEEECGEWPELAALAGDYAPGRTSAVNDIPADLGNRIAGAGTSWRTARGRVRLWRRQDLVGEAFAEALNKTGATPLLPVDGVWPEIPDDELIETVIDLWVVREPWRLRAELVAWQSEANSRSELLVVNGPKWWDVTAGATRTNGGNPNSQHGGGDLARLLSPMAGMAFFDLSVLGHESVGGRDCVVLQATLPAGDPDWEDLPLDMVSGGRDFRFSIDAERGVILRAVKVVRGDDAEINEFGSIVFDEPLPDKIFQPSHTPG